MTVDIQGRFSSLRTDPRRWRRYGARAGGGPWAAKAADRQEVQVTALTAHVKRAARWREWLDDVEYPGLEFVFGTTHPGYDDDFLQVASSALDLKGRKWRLSEHMTKSEVIQTALMAVLAWEEHEAREAFRYKGRAVFSPHYDVDLLQKLHRLNGDGVFDVRPEPQAVPA